jgi:hypothetical protein
LPGPISRNTEASAAVVRSTAGEPGGEELHATDSVKGILTVNVPTPDPYKKKSRSMKTLDSAKLILGCSDVVDAWELVATKPLAVAACATPFAVLVEY